MRCFFFNASFAEETAPKSFEELFRAGLASYQTKAYEQARDQFRLALQSEPRNAAAMSNYALSLFQLNEKGAAIAWFRRVLAIDPQNDQARAGLKYSLSQLEIKEIPHRIETFETLRESVLQYLSLRHLLALTALFLLGAGWLLLNWLGERRRALQTKDLAPPFSFRTAALCTLFLISASFLLLKIYDENLPRGTIISKKLDVKSAPGEGGVTMFELHEGFEVIIRDVQDDWVQVTYPGGLTGWIPKSGLIPTQGGAS